MPSGRKDSAGVGASGVTVNRERVADQIIRQLQNDIISGALPRGGQLPTERELAAKFGVSTPTIRESIRALSSMGLVEVRHGSGAYVVEDSQNILDASLAVLVKWESVSVLDLIKLMRVLVLHAADIAVDAADETEVLAVRTSAEETAQMEAVGDLARSVTKFLTALVACAHQPLVQAICGFLTRMVVSLEVDSHPERSTEFWKDWARTTAEQRVSIASALESRDLVLLRERINTFHDYIEARLVAIPAIQEARIDQASLLSEMQGRTRG
ncbi:GntR family transcriptional repressor for pyruvate dehydrogenase complex [Rhodococcus sp. 27YEA15]|uniref:FadR/GntR family transcriptional regulator n=1 Tax=Rhodococcus sp. 27YEA15 TaxID=3156259 RepID=UPI003C7C4A69